MDAKSKFKNVSGGVAGAVQLNHKRESAGVAVFPGESIWLTEEEEVLTANAPRNESDNPFTNGTFELEVKAEEAAYARPIGSAGESRDPEEGRRDDEARLQEQALSDQGDPEDIDLRKESTPPNAPVVPAPAVETGAPLEPDGEPVSGQRQPSEEAAAVESAPEASPRPAAGESKRQARTRTPAAPEPTTVPSPIPAPATPSE